MVAKGQVDRDSTRVWFEILWVKNRVKYTTEKRGKRVSNIKIEKSIV